MVFTTAVAFIRSRGPDKYWKRRRLFHLTSHFYGRSRNCYSVAIRYAHRALVYATKSRALKKNDMRDLWTTRVTAGCEENNITRFTLSEGLDRLGVMLNIKSLADLAIWEPRTFSSIAAIAQQQIKVDGITPKDGEVNTTGKDLEDQPILRSQLVDKKK